MSAEVRVRRFEPDDEDVLVEMIASFRVELCRLRDEGCELNLEAAREELSEFLAKGYPIYVAEAEGKPVGYLVLRVEDDVVWAEHLYVKPSFRRRGIGSSLYAVAEEYCERLGGDTVYNWVHPNNHAIIAFLKKRGYTVLNMIELRRPWPGERLSRRIRVGPYEFDY